MVRIIYICEWLCGSGERKRADGQVETHKEIENDGEEGDLLYVDKDMIKSIAHCKSRIE